MRNDGANGTGGWIFTEVDCGLRADRPRPERLGRLRRRPGPRPAARPPRAADRRRLHPPLPQRRRRRLRRRGHPRQPHRRARRGAVGRLRRRRRPRHPRGRSHRGDRRLVQHGPPHLPQRRRDLRPARGHHLPVLRGLVRSHRRHLGRLRLRRRRGHPPGRQLQLRLADRGPREGLRQRRRRLHRLGQRAACAAGQRFARRHVHAGSTSTARAISTTSSPGSTSCRAATASSRRRCTSTATTPRARTPSPSAPSGLDASRAGGRHRHCCRGARPSDDHTPAAALTYDLDLFRDGVPVYDPAPAAGARQRERRQPSGR